MKIEESNITWFPKVAERKKITLLPIELTDWNYLKNELSNSPECYSNYYSAAFFFFGVTVTSLYAILASDLNGYNCIITLILLFVSLVVGLFLLFVVWKFRLKDGKSAMSKSDFIKQIESKYELDDINKKNKDN